MSAPLAESVAMGVAKLLVREHPGGSFDADAVVHAAAPWVIELAGLDPGVDDLSVRAVSRLAWVETNLRSYSATLARAVGDGLPLGTSELNGLVIGGVLALVSSKVIGQYEPGMGGTEPVVVIVEENLRELARVAGVAEDEVGLWVMIHELTHRAQFHAVEWFLPELMGLVGQLLAVREVPPFEMIRELVLRLVHFDPAKGFDLVDLVVPQRLRPVAERATVLMTIAEGHAEWVMRRVPDAAVPHRDHLAKTMDDRRGRDSLVAQVTGLSAKRTQYSLGLQFFEALAQANPDAPRHVFDASANLPSLEELHHPHRWVERVEAAHARG